MFASLIMDYMYFFPKTIHWLITELEFVALRRTQRCASGGGRTHGRFYGSQPMLMDDESKKSKEEK